VGAGLPGIRRLTRAELPADTTALARFLIGRLLVRELDGERLVGRIVETEAYLVGDAASHAFRGRTARNGAMFLERGHAYVYFIYGIFFMLNVSAEAAGVGAGVLFRAIEPLAGVERMRALRGGARDVDIGRGPGRLASALAIDRSLDGVDLCAKGPLWLGDDGAAVPAIGESVRIGITKDADRVLRFFVPGSRHVSGPARLRAYAPGQVSERR
jgi:DNA-3-methyladenine glycosylase